MLVFARKVGQGTKLQASLGELKKLIENAEKEGAQPEDIIVLATVMPIERRGPVIRLGFEAPRNIRIDRTEVLDNKMSSETEEVRYFDPLAA